MKGRAQSPHKYSPPPIKVQVINVKWILTVTASAGAVGAVPLPGSDIVPLTVIQVFLMIKLATLYNNLFLKCSSCFLHRYVLCKSISCNSILNEPIAFN